MTASHKGQAGVGSPPNKHVPLGKDMKEQEASHHDSYTITHQKKLFSFSCEPNFQPASIQPKPQNLRPFLLFIHKSFRVYGEGTWERQNCSFLFPSFSKGNSNCPGGKREEDPRKKRFSGFIRKVLKQHEHNNENQMFKKYNWHPFDLT